MKTLFIVFVVLATTVIKAKKLVVIRLQNNYDVGFGKSGTVDSGLIFIVNGPLVNCNGTPVGIVENVTKLWFYHNKVKI